MEADFILHMGGEGLRLALILPVILHFLFIIYEISLHLRFKNRLLA